ncbi:MAG TPA: hypothetical protein VEZ55_02205, partial [Chitinophagaceae bacterium]|nr:hypothetical protein [Chitinophagaceae bacterium]
MLVVLMLLWGFLQTNWGQNWVVHRVTNKLSRDLKSRISIQHVDIAFFNKLNLKGVLIEDHKKDTLLSAGLLQVRITDWFFFKEKADLKYIGLENAIIKLQRTDSVWNYRFLEDYFSSPGTGKKKKDAGIAFNLKKLVLKNVAFLQRDAWLGRDMIVKLAGMDLDANEISISESIVDIPSIELNQPFYHIHDYTGNRPASLKPKRLVKAKAADDNLQWNAANWQVRIGKITLLNGSFRNDRDGLVATTKYFDGEHIHFRDIDGTIKNFRWTHDTISASVNLTTKERSGLLVHALNANLKMHPKQMEFKDLYLKTNRSELKNYYSMSYDDLDSMNNYIHAVTMEANFENSSVHSDDLAFFAPEVREWNKRIHVDGRIKGTVDALTARDLTVQTGNSTFLNGDVTIMGLPDINAAYINVKANDLRTTYNDAISLVPSLKQVTTPDIRSLSYLRFKGSYTGFFNDFVTYGTVQTALGTLTTDLNMKLPGKGIPVYSGKISTGGFQLGKFIRNDELGLVDFHGNVSGRGFNWDKNLKIHVDGSIHKIEYGNYTYKNIKADGTLTNRTFNGDFVIKDPNADLRLSGLIDFGGRQPRFDAHAEIAYADLRPLRLTNENLVLKGIFDLNFTGSSLSDFLGYARISKATLLQNGVPLSFDSLSLISNYVDGVKQLRVTSNELDARITGNFDLKTLPDAFQLFLNRYYPAYIKAPRKTIPPQSFSFDIQTGFIEDYVKLIDRRLSGFNSS